MDEFFINFIAKIVPNSVKKMNINDLIVEIVDKECKKKHRVLSQEELQKRFFSCHVCNTRVKLANYNNITEKDRIYCFRCCKKLKALDLFGYKVPERN